MSFESDLAVMKETVAKLEAGNLTLQESVEVYKAGLLAAKSCEAELKKEKGALTLLKNDLSEVVSEVEL